MWNALDRCSSHVAYVVGHTFEEAFGSLCDGEADYRLELRSKIPEIVMKVKGNVHEYRHPALLWDGQIAHDGVRTLNVETMRKLGDTYLWRVTQGGAYTHCPAIDWRAATIDYSQRGPIHVPGFDRITQQSLSVNGFMDVEVDCVYGAGRFLLGETRRGRIFMPKDVVPALAAKFHGRVRDPALMLDIIHACKQAIGNARMPAGEKLMSQTFAAALIFNYNIRNEIDVQNTIVNRFSSVWRIHAALVSLVPVRVVSITLLVMVGLIFTSLVLTGYFELPHFHWEVLWVMAVLLLFWVLLACSVWFRKWQSRRTGDNWSSVLFHEEEVSHITGNYTSWLPRFRFRAFSQLREPLVPPGGMSMSVEEDPFPPRHPGVQRDVLTLQGMGVATAVPTAPRTDQESEITAITHRLMTAPTVVERHAYDKFRDYASYGAGQALLNIKIEGSRMMYDEWIHQAKFTKAQQEKFQRCYEEDVQNDKLPKPGTEFNAFVKFEKMKSLTLAMIEGLKTRLVNGPPDSVKVAVGPWMARVYHEVKNAWDGTNCRILYASGMTPDAIGKKCDEFAKSVGGWENVTGVWDDCIAYDSTLENELLQIREDLYPKMGVPPITMKWLKSTANRGRSRHGVKYNLGKKTLWDGTVVDLRKLFSGELDTNLVGTMINGCAHDSGLRQDLPLLMLVCGDDNLILVAKNRMRAEDFEDLRLHLEGLGLKPTQGVSDKRGDWEFCSKLLWPAKDRQTGEVVTVLGPKPGRWLSRIAWSLTTPDSMNFRAAMLSSMHDCAHIPILSTYVATGLRLSSGQRASGKEYSELKHVTKSYAPVPEALRILEERYGTTPMHVLELIKQIQGCTKLPCVFDFSWATAAAKRDEE